MASNAWESAQRVDQLRSGGSQTLPLDRYVNTVSQSLAVFRFLSFTLGAGLVFFLNSSDQQTSILGSVVLLVGLVNVYRILWRFDPARPDWIRDRWAYIHVADLAAAVSMALITKDLQPFEALFVAAADNGTELSSRSLIREYLSGVPRINGAFGRRESFISSERARARLAFVPKMSWTEFLR